MDTCRLFRASTPLGSALIRYCQHVPGGWRETSSVGRSRIDDDRCSRRGTHLIEKLLAEIVAFGPEPA